MSKKARWALIVTVLYLGGLLCVFGWDIWDLIRQKRLGEIGDFTAGVLTPVFLGWLVLGYFLQRDEFSLQRQELGLQRQELEQTRKTLSTQVDVLKAQADAERRRSTPNLLLEGGERADKKREFVLRNIGGPARDLTLYILNTGSLEEVEEKPRSLDTDEIYQFSIPDPSSPDPYVRLHYCSVYYVSEIQEAHEKRWRVDFSHRSAPAKIQEDTEGFIPSKAG